MEFFSGSRNSISIVFDGTKEDLSKKIDNISTVLGRRNFYTNDINKIKSEILSDFDKYKEYTTLYYGFITLRNKSLSGFNPYFKESDIKKPFEEPLYSWFYTKILLYFLAFFILFFIFIICYCYIFNIDTYQYMTSLII